MLRESEVGRWQKSDQALWASPAGSTLFEGFCRIFFTCYCPLGVEGRDHLPAGPFLLCSNHTSHADSAALMTASGRSFASFALLGASDYFFWSPKVRRSVSPLMNVIPIERRPAPKSLASSLAACRQFLQNTGGALILYPEGTRSLDGVMSEFKAGVGLFAIELDVPVVPAYVEGTHQILPKGRSLPRPGRVMVRFGEPLTLGKLSWKGKSIRDQRRDFVAKLAESVRMLSAAHQTPALVTGIHEKPMS